MFEVAITPAVKYGIGLNLQPQNVLVRINVRSKEVSGFAIRDFGNMRIHGPTLEGQGTSLPVDVLDSGVVLDNIHYFWDHLSYCLIQCHVAGLVYSLGLENFDGWGLVRGVLADLLHAINNPRGTEMYEYLTRATMRAKGFYSDVRVPSTRPSLLASANCFFFFFSFLKYIGITTRNILLD